jgi:UDP-N-acetyl-2-amino-2-deoxyglucuronate dehydrogenase
MGKTKIRFVIIGYGRIGQRHQAALNTLVNVALVAIVDPVYLPNGNESFECFKDIVGLLQSKLDFEVGIVATPNGLHETHSVQLLNAGKHVVIEKPMALSKEGCENILHSALKKGKFVFCVMQLRYTYLASWLKKQLEQGHLGNIFTLQVNCFWNRDERYYKKGSWHGTDLDGGVLFTQFSHFIDFIYWIFGDVNNIQARFRNNSHSYLPDTEDTGIVTFDLKRGGTGCLHYSTATFNKNFESSVSILAEKGTLKITGQYLENLEYCHLQSVSVPTLSEVLPTLEYHRQLLENVVDTLLGHKSVTTNALEGLKVVEIIENIYKSKS